MEEKGYRVLPIADVRRARDPRATTIPRLTLDPRRVPEELWHLIPMAEKWGITDDLLRDELSASSTPEEILALKRSIAEHDDLLDFWLAGPEADSPEPSVEYLAFSAMRMAADAL